MTAALGHELRRLRLAKQLTQLTVADAVDVGVPHISKIEHGVEEPGYVTLRRLCDVLDGDMVQMLVLAGRCTACGALHRPSEEAGRG